MAFFVFAFFTLLTNGASPPKSLREKIKALGVSPNPALDSNKTKQNKKYEIRNQIIKYTSRFFFNILINIFVTMYIFLSKDNKVTYLYDDVISIC